MNSGKTNEQWQWQEAISQPEKFPVCSNFLVFSTLHSFWFLSAMLILTRIPHAWIDSIILQLANISQSAKFPAGSNFLAFSAILSFWFLSAMLILTRILHAWIDSTILA